MKAGVGCCFVDRRGLPTAASAAAAATHATHAAYVCLPLLLMLLLVENLSVHRFQILILYIHSWTGR